MLKLSNLLNLLSDKTIVNIRTQEDSFYKTSNDFEITGAKSKEILRLIKNGCIHDYSIHSFNATEEVDEVDIWTMKYIKRERTHKEGAD